MKTLLILLFLLVISAAISLIPRVDAQKASLVFGNEQNLSLDSYGIKWTPDGHISYITLPDDKKRFFISGNQRAYTVDTSSSQSLADDIMNNPAIKENFGPDVNVSYRNNYSTIGSVVQIDSANTNHIFAFTQNEEQLKKADGTYDYSNFTSTIGLLESLDGGLTWKDFGPVIRGDDYLVPGTRITGAGEPTAVIKDGYIYVYFVDWSAKGLHQDQIYLARTRIFPDKSLGAFEFYTYNGFSNQELNLAPVIPVPNVPGAKYASLPSVSYNKYLGMYLAVYETDLGFFMSLSRDGISFIRTKMIFSFPKPQSQRQTGDIWYSYPSLLSDKNETSDLNTLKTGNLYYAKGVWPNTSHQLNAKPFDFNIK